MPKWPWWKWMLVMSGGVVGLIAVAGVGTVALAIVSSRAATSRFEGLVARTTVGSPLATLLADPALDRCAAVTASGAFAGEAEVPPAGDAELQDLLSAFRASPAARTGAGQLDLMWYSLPPFGRLFLHVEYADGQVAAVRSSSLD